MKALSMLDAMSPMFEERTRHQAPARLLTLLCLGYSLLSGCGTTLRDVPTLKAHELDFHGFPSLSPPDLSLAVVDERPGALREHTEQLTSQLQALLAETLTEQALSISPTASAKLTLRVQAVKAGDLADFDPERCVLLVARLERPNAFFAEAMGMGCHHFKHAFGFVVGGNISEAYRVAMREMLRTLAQQLERLGPAPARAGGGEAGS